MSEGVISLSQQVRDAKLNDLLQRYHQWMLAYNPARGFATRAVVFGSVPTSRSYDASNGALDDHLEADVMKAVDFQVGEMKEPYRAAIYYNARALAVGVGVFRNPRLPADDLERAQLVVCARGLLAARLIAAGVM